ncbi:PAS domain S-box protein [Halomonas sp. KAO]|uniref:ATP-binding protein n=1 Tax=unclassified Halomonas TaxID=2609666 RepID=UPI0018A07B46|nr:MULTISPECIES: ATP-binding protein [unclassified Halomonas]MBF7053457.1 PAS domain S-box protein [Halomonas sp. KAO]MDT0502166.1 ATP-binding protein [Halomonas sp. PAR7]MDT0513606.1 ATP-binding protein [Halomonas sp. LES1]MDT0593059.1 ATP-binding protein [Halomonas sp. PAR8]
MNASLVGMLGVGACFLLLLWLCALAVERGWISTHVTRHPLVYVLALGVYASAWAIYGSLELAATSGYGYLTYYLGMAGAFLLAPVLLVPIQRMVRTHQLASLADLFAFRYRSRWVGTLITLVSLLAVLPLLALQVQTMGNAIYLMTGAASPATLALVFCVLLALFDMTFVGRRQRIDGQHDSLLAVMALSSLIKLLAMLGLGGFALFAIFDGPADVQAWLEGPGQAFQSSVVQTDPAHWRSLLLLFFAGLLMPHIFHLVFTETRSRHTLLQASWALPLFLLLMALPVPLILWAGQRLGLDATFDTGYLAFGLSESLSLKALAFLAGLAATSATTLLIALALSGMLTNHVFLVAHPPEAHHDLYRWLRWLRRGLVAAVVLGGWLFYRIVGVHHDLTSLGLAAFVGMAQCLPGLLALLYWPGANRRGMVAGLIVGVGVWLSGLWVPLLTGLPALAIIPPGLEALSGEPAWYTVTLVSLASNAMVLIVVSLATPTSEGERAAAEACSVDAVIRPKRLPLEAASGEEFKPHLARALGESVARREVDRALDDLGLSPLDGRPYALRRLRDRLQANLSGLMGPSVAQDIVDRYLPYRQGGPGATEDIHFVESRLEAYRSRLTGLARELDGLRRYHRRTLTRLPVGLCAFGEDGELLMWNDALARLSGIEGSGVVGARRESLPAPWNELLGRIIAEPESQLYKHPVTLDGTTRYLSLHKAALEGSHSEPGGMVILIEDHSEMKWLEDELVHAARLASIGQLAAGVAHEIGNPITGISSLAQNLRFEADDPEVVETTEQIQQLTDRVSRIVSSLVGFAHGGRHLAGRELVPVAIAEVVDEAIHLIHLARSREDVRFDNRCSREACVEGDAQRLLQVMVNLLGNARDASGPGDSVTVETVPEGSGVRVSVTDEGAGIDPSVRDHLFEPFTTTKPPGEGTGLGLPLVYSIVAEHHGTLDVESPLPESEGGTRISLWLPRHQKEGERPR